MTGKRCTNCRHTKGIGYDFWCGEGHTEYEVFGAETNCPYYEYHDWSKGIPMTKKQFVAKNESVINVATDELVNASSDESAEIIVYWLNELLNGNEQLKKQLEGTIKMIHKEAYSYEKCFEELTKENKKLKQFQDDTMKLIRSFKSRDLSTIEKILITNFEKELVEKTKGDLRKNEN